jgi:hypothetical protein
MTTKIIKQRQGQLIAAKAVSLTDGKVISFENQLEQVRLSFPHYQFGEFTDNLMRQLEKKVKSLHWRAIRLASTMHFRLFSKIGAGDLEVLLGLIESERVKLEEKKSERSGMVEIVVEEKEKLAAVESKSEEGVKEQGTVMGEEKGAEEKLLLSPTSKRARSDEEVPSRGQEMMKKTRFGP